MGRSGFLTTGDRRHFQAIPKIRKMKQTRAKATMYVDATSVPRSRSRPKVRTYNIRSGPSRLDTGGADDGAVPSTSPAPHNLLNGFPLFPPVFIAPPPGT